MTHLITARAQVRLSYLVVAGFFGCLAGEGLGYLKAGTAQSVREAVLLVLFFWFQRQRPNEPSPEVPLKEPAP